MGTLKCETKTIITVKYSDMEKFIKAETGLEYEIPYKEEYCNDTAHTFKVNAKLDEYMRNDWVEFKAGANKERILRTILCGLCLEGKIQPGDYLVKVSW